ncbi:MAG: hypothetical protein U0842_10330 [Candidatus Binatia bacterium]
MAQEHQVILGAIVRSIDKKLEWEALSAQGDLVRLTVRQAGGEASMDVTRAEIAAATEPGIDRNRLRERVKRAQKRIFDGKPAYMPWRLPKIEPIGAPGPRSGGWGPSRR